MTLQEYCQKTINSTNKLYYNFKDRKRVDSEKAQAKNGGCFYRLGQAEVIKTYSRNGKDFVCLDVNFADYCVDVCV